MVTKALPLALIATLALLGHVSVEAFLTPGLLALIVGCIWMWFRLGVQFERAHTFSMSLFRASLHYAVKAYFAAFFAFLVLRADLFMVQRMLGTEQAGYYSVASSMADYVSVAAVVISTVLFPRLSAMTDVKAKLELTRKTAAVTAAVLLPFLVVSSVLARPVVHLLFGAAYLPAAQAFVLLMPGMLFLGIHSVAVQFLNSIGYPVSVVIIWGVCCLINIVANIWIIPHFGIRGASIVSSACYFLAFYAVLWVIRSTARVVMAEPVTIG
jgi:O-antigen/teichoic acid export membrane protein